MEVLGDRDLSAYKAGVFRPGYEALQEAVRSRRVDAVIVWSTTRLARSVREFSRLLSLLEEHDVALASCRDPIDTSTPTGRAMTQLHGVFAELESAMISSRVTDARAYAARQGKPKVGGTRTFGYERDGTLIPEEAAVVREIADRLLSGDSITGLARDLNRRGIRTTQGNEWARQSVRSLILSATVAGIRTYKGEEFPGDWDAIVSRDEQLRIQALRRSDYGSGKGSTTVLGGMIYCGRCGEKMSFVGSRQRYSCPSAPGLRNCGRMVIQAAHAEPEVIERALSFLSRARLRPLEESSGREIDDLQAELHADERALDEASNERYLLRTMSPDRYEALRNSLQERMQRTRERLEAMSTMRASQEIVLPPGDRESLDRWWEAATMNDQRAAIRQVVERVEILPASRKGAPFTPERVRVRFAWSAFLMAAESATDEETEALEEYERIRSEVEAELAG